MHVVEFERGDRSRVGKLSRHERMADQRDRLRAVALALDGMDAPAIAAKIGRSRRFVQQWVYAYRDGGLEAIRSKPRPGRASFLSQEQRDQLAQRLRDGPAESDGISALRGRDVIEIIRSISGRTYSLSGVYDLLHAMGFEPLAPRPRHPGHDPKKAKAFVRRSAPLL